MNSKLTEDNNLLKPDPKVSKQEIGLITFIPAKGSKPDENDVYGVLKLRGNFPSEEEAKEYAEYLINNVEEDFKIYHSPIGKYTRLTTSSKYSKVRDEVADNMVTKEIIKQVEEDKSEKYKELNEIKHRERNLLDETRKKEHTGETGIDKYITERVKLANLRLYFESAIDKLKDEVIPALTKCKHGISDLNKEDKSYRLKFMKKYMDARKEAGIPEESNTLEGNKLIEYVVSEYTLDFIKDKIDILNSIEI